MACIEKIYSVSALVGDGKCNGNCKFCAGKYLRPQAQEQSPLYMKNFVSAIRLCARYGGWSLSLTSSGEPTCDPEAVTRVLHAYQGSGVHFPNVNLFTNGILVGDDNFCDYWLPKWKLSGLTNVCVSIHCTDLSGQAHAYGFFPDESNYPPFENIFNNIRRHGLGVRATLLLNKPYVHNRIMFEESIHTLIEKYKVDNITCWPVSNPDGSRNKYTPDRMDLLGIRWWLRTNAKLCHGHVWGGGVYDYKGNIIRLTSYVTKHNPKKDFVRQLVVFQDGTVAYSWIREGALCMK